MTDMRPEAHDYSIANVFPRLGETGTTQADHRSPAKQGAPEMHWLRSRVVLLRRRLSHQRRPAFRQRRDGTAVPEPVRQAAGQGLSSSTVNVLWGFFNLVVGYLLVCRVGDFDLRDTGDVVALGARRSPDRRCCLARHVRPLPRRQRAGAFMSASATGIFRSLRSFNYRVWAAGAFVSNIGTWMQRTAQDWLVLTAAHASQRLGRRHRHGAAVRTAAPAAAAGPASPPIISTSASC